MFEKGEWVRITREGVSYDSLGAVVGVELYKGDYIYRVSYLKIQTLK
jgi:hypothetical protein